MDPRFFRSRFSTHFNRLTYLGMWSADNLVQPMEKKLFVAYQILCGILLFVSIALQMIDLYLVFGNLRKVTYNFCTSVIVVGVTLKIIFMRWKKNNLNDLRVKLWKDSIKYTDREDVAIQDVAYSQLRLIRTCLYVAASVFLPIWIIASYFSYKWGPRQLAFAGYLPMPDRLNDSHYVPALTFQAFCGCYIISLVIEVDLALLSLALQMEAYYQMLNKNILKLNEIYGPEHDEMSRILRDGPPGKTEVNVYLKRESGQKLLKLLIVRHLEILKYSKIFEHIFNSSMLVQLVAGSLLVIMNGLELSMYAQEMSVKLYFQSGYVLLILVDIHFICYHLSRLSTESFNIGTAAYSTVWYKMDTDLKRSLSMIIARSQKPPKITAGKLFIMDLPTYLHMVRNIYSWLMLFRQLGSK